VKVFETSRLILSHYLIKIIVEEYVGQAISPFRYLSWLAESLVLASHLRPTATQVKLEAFSPCPQTIYSAKTLYSSFRLQIGSHCFIFSCTVNRVLP